MSAPSGWQRVCALDDIIEYSGVGALLDGVQVAVFRVAGAAYAIGNRDPASGANVLSRGIVGDLGGELVVASPIYKQHYSLVTGRCLEDAQLWVPVHLTRIADGAVWVKLQVQHRARPKQKLVVIGSGVAAMRTIEEVLARASHGFQITVFGAEMRGSYNRVLLSPLLAGEKKLEEIITHPPEWYRQQGIDLHEGDAVVAIDRVQRRVHSARGIEVPYDRLLIATGGLPVMLNVPGATLPGVLGFRDVADVDAMLVAARTHRRAVIIGGGLLGLEAGNGLARQGMDVTVVDVAEHVMNRQLDAHAAQLLRAELEGRGLKFVLPARTTAILGDERVTGVQLADGNVLAADLVVMAVGVKPNIELARAAGVRCDRGILVDDTLQTFDPAIYAVGECVQHRNATFGLVAPLLEQAQVCGQQLAGHGVARYPGSRLSTQLKISGVDVFSAGDYLGNERSEMLVLRDARRGIYKRLVVEDNRVRGAVLYGDTRDGRWYFDLINEQRDIRLLRDRLLFGEAECQSSP